MQEGSTIFFFVISFEKQEINLERLSKMAPPISSLVIRITFIFIKLTLYFKNHVCRSTKNNSIVWPPICNQLNLYIFIFSTDLAKRTNWITEVDLDWTYVQLINQIYKVQLKVKTLDQLGWNYKYPFLYKVKKRRKLLGNY